MYDGLAGISQRQIIRDVVEELARREPSQLSRFLEAMRRHRSGYVYVYFADYVSYGVGGGDTTSEFYFGSFLMLHEPARPAGDGPAAPEHIALRRPAGWERATLDGVPLPSRMGVAQDGTPTVEPLTGE